MVGLNLKHNYSDIPSSVDQSNFGSGVTIICTYTYSTAGLASAASHGISNINPGSCHLKTLKEELLACLTFNIEEECDGWLTCVIIIARAGHISCLRQVVLVK